MIDKLDGQSLDVVKENVEKLKELFPSIVKEDKIDFDELELLLGENINRSNEQYSFTWNGKTEATKLAQKRSTGTLRPCKEESKDWDTTQNLYIEGDNLEVLRLLQASYNGKIKMIYIDPPYNTGHDFVYKDNFEDNIKNYKEQTGQAVKSNADTDGRYHTNWLNMMYPRLKLARTLLKDDGVIFISIDDNEVANLKKICDEVFGENNWKGTFCWRKTHTQTNIGDFARVKEYILCYSRNVKNCIFNKIPLTNLEEYRYEDENGEKFRRVNLIDSTRGRYEYEITNPNGNIVKGKWMKPKDEVLNMINNNEVYWAGQTPYGKNFLKTMLEKGQIANDFLGIEFGTNQRSTMHLDKLMGNIRVFDFSKPIELIRHFLLLATKEQDIVLDFFSGSATTAHAVMQLNAEDDGNRKFIMVQLPELTEEDSEAYKAGYKNICEIGKERIRRAGAEIKGKHIITMVPNLNKPVIAEKIIDKKGQKIERRTMSMNISSNSKFLENLDIGFKVFKLDSSNLKKWDNTPTKDVDEIQNRIQTSIEYIKEDRNELDLVYEVMLKYGIDLSLPITKTQNEKAYIIEAPEYKLLVCTYPNLTIEDIEDFANESVGTYLFADRCFNTDNLLVNVEEILKSRNKEMRLF